MIKNKTFKIISGTLLATIILFVGFFVFSSNEIEAKTYKVKVGSKTVYVRTAHGASYAKKKAQKAFKNGKLMSGCRNVSYKCHWCRPVNPPPPQAPDRCPNIPGKQTSVPTGYELIGGQCLQDACTNISGFQESVPDGYQDVGGRICQLSSDFSVSCRAQDPIVKPGETAVFVATPFNNSASVIFEWYDGASSDGNSSSQTSNGPVSITRTYSSEGNKRVTVVATDTSGARSQRTCGVMVSENEDDIDDLINDGLLDLDGDGLPDIDLNATRGAEITATADLQIDRSLTNSTCKLTWTSQNAIECLLVNKSSGASERVDLNGSRDVSPGEYYLRCISPTLKITETDSKVCRLNFDIREI